MDSDLAATTDYHPIVAEILEKRCGAGVSNVFPGLGSDRPGVVRAPGF